MMTLNSKSGIGRRDNLPIKTAEEKLSEALKSQNPQWWSDESGNCPRCVDYQLKLADPSPDADYQI